MVWKSEIERSLLMEVLRSIFSQVSSAGGGKLFSVLETIFWIFFHYKHVYTLIHSTFFLQSIFLLLLLLRRVPPLPNHSQHNDDIDTQTGTLSNPPDVPQVTAPRQCT